jgi:hypothetical protein
MKMRYLSLATLAGTALVLLSCSDRHPLTPDSRSVIQAAAVAGNSSHGLLPCRPLAYDSATLRIGPQGGSIRVSRHVLDIPPHAITRPVDITVVAPSDTVNRVEFRPEGLVFGVPVRLTMSYQNCFESANPKGIAYTTDSLQILEDVPAKDDPRGKKVAGKLDHFSSYAVSW